MEQCFASFLDDDRLGGFSKLLLSLTVPDILKQSKFSDHEVNIIKNFALEKRQRERILKQHVAVSIKEQYFSVY